MTRHLVVCWAIPLWILATGLVSTARPADAQPAESPSVAVVFGDYSYMDSPRGEGANALTFMKTLRAALDAVGVPYVVVSDMTVETGGLSGYKVAVLPYSFVLPEAEQAALERFVSQGGKVIVCYSITPKLAALLGVEVGERREGDFQAIALRPDLLAGLPDRVIQNSWGVMPAKPAGPGTEVIGGWVDSAGRPLDVAAVLVSPTGAYIGHVLTDTDLANKGRMLLAVLGRFVPDMWQQASSRAIAEASATIDSMAERALARSDPAARQKAGADLDRARAKLTESRGLHAAGESERAVIAAGEAAQVAKLAVVRSAPERPSEFRAVWLHNAYGVPGWGWERTARELAANGFNATIVNMLWAGIAHYPSDCLPVAPEVATAGDQIAEALRFCKQYGVELHVWKVNYNLQGAPDEFVQKLREEGRLQHRLDGTEVLWLCPSDPRNFALEHDSMLEVVRRYDVAGIHFDYIRYPESDSCYCDGCRRRFAQTTGMVVERWPEDVTEGPLAEQYAQWRRDQVTRLVRAVATEARTIRPGVMVSAAVFAWPGAIRWVGQDWRQWVSEGLLDFVCPMNYTASANELEQMVTGEVNIVEGRIPLYIGIGEFIIPDDADLVDQIERARRLGADGFVCFSYEHLGPSGDRLAGLHAGLTATTTSPPHPAPRVALDLAPGRAGSIGPVYPAGGAIGVSATLTSDSNYGSPLEAASGMVVVETTDGREVERLGRVRLGSGQRGEWSLKLPPGMYRLVVRGRASVAGTGARDFIVRSRPFEVSE
ncbi:MAG: family 10 glycosylhydrolase [Armatimonadota bacterium]